MILIDSVSNFQELASSYPGIVSTRNIREVFYTPEWFSLLEGHGNTFHGKTQLIVAQDASRSTGICLPTIDGRDLLSLSNYYSSLFAPIGDPDAVTAELCQSIAKWLYGHAKRWPQLRLQPMDTTTPLFVFMLPALKMAGYWADSYSCFGNWYLDVAGRSFNDYLLAVPSRLRHTISRNRRKMERLDGVGIRIHEEPGEALEAAIERFGAIYRRSWKPAESHPEFVAELCRMGARNGWLRLGILEVKGIAVAAQIWLVMSGKASIFKLAHIDDHHAFSAGTVLTAALMEHVIDVDQVSEVDYLTGDDDYKKDWMSHRRERKGIVAFHPKTATGLLMGGRHFAGKLTKRLSQSTTCCYTTS